MVAIGGAASKTLLAKMDNPATRSKIGLPEKMECCVLLLIDKKQRPLKSEKLERRELKALTGSLLVLD